MTEHDLTLGPADVTAGCAEDGIAEGLPGAAAEDLPGAIAVGVLADAVTGGNECAMRKLLNSARGHVDEYATDRNEMVTRTLVLDLFALRAGDRVGHKLAGVLCGGM